MKTIFGTFLFWALILSACTPGVASPPPLTAATTEAPAIIPTTAVPTLPPATTEAPTLPPTTVVPTEPCGYQWAYQDLPELSSSFQQAVQALPAEAQANAYAFGENCVGADGSVVTFLAMETDFNITLQVASLANEDDLGEWIVKVMQVIENIPQDQMMGPQPGRVRITFQTGAEQKVVNFSINQYRGLPAGLSNAEIFQALQVSQ